MRNSMRLFLACALVGFGYFLGSTQVFQDARAQQEDELPSEDALKKISEAYNALKSASQVLAAESRYSSITRAINPYSILVGGINVKADLESGQGVDPETFAALSVAAYDLKKNNMKEEKNDDDNDLSEWVTDKKTSKESLLDKLGFDNNGRLTYDNKVVKMYSIAKLRRLNAQRIAVLNLSKDQKNARQK
jgi:hypothetical protein